MGVEVLVVFLLNKVKVNKILRFGFGFGFSKNRIDLFVLDVVWILSGVKIFWLIVLFKNKILVGLMKMLVNGNSFILMI